jgi:Kef-type K+ transport system membrane component KefB
MQARRGVRRRPMTLLCLAGALLSALAFYLASAHQQWRPGWRVHARWLRGGAWLLAVLALVVAIAALGVWAGVFCALTAFMLGAVLLPYLDAWRRLRRERRHVG